jgi:hypothetical protein
MLFKKAALGVFILALGVLACGSSDPLPKMNLYATVTVEVTQTPLIIVISETPNATQTPAVILVTETPNALCVYAIEAVYLRPSPSIDNYPVTAVPNAAKVYELGGKSGEWIFVRYGTFDGWINSSYIKDCGEK